MIDYKPKRFTNRNPSPHCTACSLLAIEKQSAGYLIDLNWISAVIDKRNYFKSNKKKMLLLNNNII